MKKCLLFLSMFLLFVAFSFGESVDVRLAEKVAKNYLQQSQHWGKVLTLEMAEKLSITTPSAFQPGSYEDTPLVYVFNVGDDQGFLLVSGDDVATPILGFVEQGSYDKATMPYNFQKWLEGYKRQIAYAIQNKLEAENDVEYAWETLKNGGVLEGRSTTAVNPLLSTTWSQAPHVNALCPGGSVTGCVATAMAQVMKYWNHPAQGSGMHSYNHSTYGTLSANFGATTYQWSSMPNAVNSSNNAVATLMYHCGVSVDMNYSPQESGAWVVESDDPVCSESALKNYFGYATSLHGEKRDGNYTTSQWVQLVKGELDASRPLLYAGFGGGGGHAFVCDGYDNNDYFHFNWGWGGDWDGYFHIDALNPGGTGTGGGSGGYNSGHQGVFGVVPATGSTDHDLRLYEAIAVSPNPINYGQGFSVTTKVGNYGNNNFAGDLTAVVFDNNGTAVEFVEILAANITAQYWAAATFTSSGSAALLPGSYTISVYYRPQGEDWMQVAGGEYSNQINFTVGNDNNDIKLYEAISVSGGNTIVKGQSVSVYLNVGNYGTGDFYGTFDVSLYDLEGYFVETIEAMTNISLPSQSYFTNGLTFTTSGITSEPGSYLLALQQKENGGSWELTGSNTFANPIQVIVTAASLQGDMYENNDELNYAYSMPVSFSGNAASVLTTGSNSHTGSDYDYYQVNLPSGYNYTINARTHDSYNSGNGQSYTNDVLWSFYNNGFWSNAYDDVMLGNITVNGGGTIAFLVAPYFLGETGTYLMDIQVNRAPAGIDDVSGSNIKVYPNPATDFVHIEANTEDQIVGIQLNDMMGKELLRMDNLESVNQTIHVPVQELPTGSYLMLIQTEDHIWQKKILKLD